MINLSTYKELRKFPSARVWSTGHLRIEVLEIDGIGCFLLPCSINFGCYDLRGDTYNRLHTTIGKYNYVSSSNFYTNRGLLEAYKHQLRFQRDYLKEQGGDGRIPLISRPNYLKNGEDALVTVDFLSKGFTNLEETLAYVESLSFTLVRNKEPKLLKDSVLEIVYFGKLLNKLFVVNKGDAKLASQLGITVSTCRTMRTEAKVPVKHKARIKSMDIWS